MLYNYNNNHNNYNNKIIIIIIILVKREYVNYANLVSARSSLNLLQNVVLHN